MKTLLTIAGFDPSSGAGVTADLAVFAAHGFFGTAAITALTVQSTAGVRATQAVSGEWLRETLDCLVSDLPPAGIKIGMLATEDNVLQVTEMLRKLRPSGQRVPVVLDPVIRSSSGRELLSAAAVLALRESLLPLVDWVTPNLEELAVLTGLRVTHAAEAETAVALLGERVPSLGIVATGGHLERADDLVASNGAHVWLRGEKIVSRSTHGTGCAFSSAMLCHLVNGMSGVEAAHRAKDYVGAAIRSAPDLGHGCGPLNLRPIPLQS
jgi:hydroxymethylpyrimidine/phosphomethylpyrimidine kinase